jgi:hypothetical protein
VSPLSPSSSGPASAAGGALTQIFDSLLAAPAASFDVTGISAAFTHLMLVGYLRGDTASITDSAIARLNNDSAASYDSERLQGSVTTASAVEGIGGTSVTLGVIPAANATAGYFGAVFGILPAYTNATGDKPVLAPFWSGIANTTTNQFVGVGGGKWRTTATPVSRLTILPGSGQFVTGSRFSLYGIT